MIRVVPILIALVLLFQAASTHAAQEGEADDAADAA